MILITHIQRSMLNNFTQNSIFESESCHILDITRYHIAYLLSFQSVDLISSPFKKPTPGEGYTGRGRFAYATIKP